MASAFRLKTQPEVLFTMLMQARAELDSSGNGDVDLNPGSVWRTFLEICSESDADQYIQIGKLLKLFSIFTAKGQDLDQRMLDFGAEIFPEMRRLAANTSIAYIAVGDGTLLDKSTITDDLNIGDTTFNITAGAGVDFPISGAMVLEQGTPRQETIIFSRSTDTFTVLFPLTGVGAAHPQGAGVVSTAIRSFLQADTIVGATTIPLPAGTGAAWNASGDVVVDQGTVSEEKKAFTRSGDTLTVAALGFAHLAGATIVQSTFGSDRNIPVGQICFVPATDTTQEIDFRVTQAGAKLKDGDFVSDLVGVESKNVGSNTRVGSNTIVKWQSPPFANATVTNPVTATRGRDREEDSDYVQRVVDFIQSLSRGTPLATTTLVSGVIDPDTGAQVAFAQIIEPVAPGMSLLYISDGSAAFSLNQQPFIGRDVLISDAEAGDRRGKLSQFGPFALTPSLVPSLTTPRLFKSYQRGTASSVAANVLNDTSQSWVTNFYVGAYLKTDDNAFYEILSNTSTQMVLDAGGVTPSLGAYSILDFGTNPHLTGTSTSVGVNTLTDTTQSMTVNEHANKYLQDSFGLTYLIISNTATAFTIQAGGGIPFAGAYKVTSGDPRPLFPKVDYQFNQTNGDVELTNARFSDGADLSLSLHDSLVAASDGGSPSNGAYTYTQGLGAYVQRLINGDPTDFINFPGIRADGTQVLVIAPTTISANIVIQVVAARGFSDADIEESVQTAVVTYINSLGIGDNVLISEIIRVVKSLVGVADCKVIDPLSNITVPAGSLMRVANANIGVV